MEYAYRLIIVSLFDVPCRKCKAAKFKKIFKTPDVFNIRAKLTYKFKIPSQNRNRYARTNFDFVHAGAIDWARSVYNNEAAVAYT